jgi:hypothetical protein
VTTLVERETEGKTPNKKDAIGQPWIAHAPPSSTQFLSPEIHDATMAAVLQIFFGDRERRGRRGDIFDPPQGTDDTKYRYQTDFNRAVGQGYIGSGTKGPHPTRTVSGKTTPAKVYPTVTPSGPVSRTQSTIEWIPAEQQWVLVQHFPTTEKWDIEQQTYTQPGNKSARI